MEKLIKKFSPVTEATYYILLALIEPLHGYGVMKKVEQMSNGRIIIAAGTLYGAFSSLEKNKLIEHLGVDPNNSRRKLYQLTESGNRLIRYEVHRLMTMAQEGAREMEGLDV